MLYSRAELVDLVRDIAPEIAELLIALCWFASHCDVNLISGERYGLLQVDLNQARSIGFQGEPNQLLDPRTNIQLAAKLIHTRGLIQYCGRTLGMQLPAIVRLEAELKQGNEPVEANQNSFQ